MQMLESSTAIGFRNILFLTDFSEASHGAMDYAATLASQFGAKLYAGYVDTPMTPPFVEGAALSSLFDEFRAQSRARLTALMTPYGIQVQPLVAEGLIEYALERWTVMHGIDLIVVGTHGRRGLQKMLMGSTAELILRSATCPVLTVRHDVAHGHLREPAPFSRILFPTDLTPASEAAVSYALSFAHEHGARLTLLHVLKDAEHTPDHSRVMRYCMKQLEELVAADHHPGLELRLVVQEGDPATEICNVANQDDCDLVVLGLPRAKEFGNAFRAGVTYTVVTAAPCPVLTMRDMLTDVK
jgi:nucleotide-binding universal stress UspA family protein